MLCEGWDWFIYFSPKLSVRIRENSLDCAATFENNVCRYELEKCYSRNDNDVGFQKQSSNLISDLI